MSQFFESIRVQEGKAHELEAHQQRINRCLKVYKGEPLRLENIAYKTDFPKTGLYKWRVQYGLAGVSQSILSPYNPSQVVSMSIVTADHISYQHKFEDRRAISQLLKASEHSDIIMLKKGLITDSSYANLVFFDGQQWLTPKTPMLPGTQRAVLLAQGSILEADIRPETLDRFTVFKRINALMTFETSPNLPIGLITSL